MQCHARFAVVAIGTKGVINIASVEYDDLNSGAIWNEEATNKVRA